MTRTAPRITPLPGGEGVITAVVAERGRSERLAVYLDGIRAFDVAAVVADSAGLQVGVVLDGETQRRLLEEDAPYRARERALGWLAVRDRSCHELAERLHGAGFTPDVAAGVLAWLRDFDYVDDARFAAAYVSAKLKCGWGERRIRAELQRKGVARGVIEGALGQADSDGGCEAAEGLAAVTALVTRRFGRQFESDPAGAARRVAGFLGRRGYDWDTINAVTRALTEEAGGEGAVQLP